MEDLQKLYNCIKDVIATDEELELNLDCVEELKKAYEYFEKNFKTDK